MYIDWMKNQFVTDIGIKSLQQKVDKIANLQRTMNMKFGCSSKQIHRPDETGKSKNMVTMVMTDEDMTDVHHGEAHLLHLRLHTFATVNHEEFASDVQYLRGWLMTGGWLG
jgi:hypothetical protein